MAEEGVVLVIDDDESIRQLVQSVLEDEGCRVVTADSIEAAIHAIETFDVRLVLLDLLLEGESGQDFLDRRDELGSAHVPVVLLSGWDAPTGFPKGIVGHIAKPFDLDDLVRVVDEHLRPS